MPDALAHIYLSVSMDVRRRLRELAARSHRTEAAVARELLVDALERSRRAEFHRRVAEAHTDANRARDLEIVRAFEQLRG